jgi:hypothetical protein
MNFILRGVGVLMTVGVVSVLAFSLPSGEAHGDALPRLNLE